jgi:hypothetical protein
MVKNNTCDASTLNSMVTIWEQSNTRKRLRVTLNVRFLSVSFNLTLAGYETLAEIKSLLTFRWEGGRAHINLQFQNMLQYFPFGWRFFLTDGSILSRLGIPPLIFIGWPPSPHLRHWGKSLWFKYQILCSHQNFKFKIHRKILYGVDVILRRHPHNEGIWHCPQGEQ